MRRVGNVDNLSMAPFIAFAIFSLGSSLVYASDISSGTCGSSNVCTPVESPLVYVVERGDHLAHIMRTFGFKPLYGKRSWIKQVTDTNNISDPNLILPGQELSIPFRCEEDVRKFILTLSNSGRRQITLKAREQCRREVAQAEVSTSAENREPRRSVNAAETTDFNPHSVLSLSGLYGFYRLDSIDSDDGSEAQLLSKPSLGASIGWNFHWTSRFSTGFDLAVRSIELQNSSLGTLQSGTQTLSGLGFDVQYQWTDRLRSRLGLNYSEKLWVYSLQLGTAAVESYQQPAVRVGLQYELVRAGALGLDLQLDYRKLTKTSTTAFVMQDGDEGLIGARLFQRLENVRWVLLLNYLRTQQRFDVSKQVGTGIEAAIGIEMEIGK